MPLFGGYFCELVSLNALAQIICVELKSGLTLHCLLLLVLILIVDGMLYLSEEQQVTGEYDHDRADVYEITSALRRLALRVYCVVGVHQLRVVQTFLVRAG